MINIVVNMAGNATTYPKQSRKNYILDTDGVIGNQMKRSGTVLYHIKKSGVRVRLCSC